MGNRCHAWVLAPLAAIASVAAEAQLINLEPELLPAHEAFAVSAGLHEQALQVTLASADGYYLYRDRFAIEPVGDAVLLEEVDLPAGKVITDEFFGEVSTYRGTVAFSVPFAWSATPVDFAARVVVQGCADYGVCYPPQEVTVAFAAGGGPGEVSLPTTAIGAELPVRLEDNTARLRGILASGGAWLIFAAFFNAGLLLAFTPCVLPMVPIVLAVTTRGARPGGGRAIALGITYVLGMAVTYTVLGMAAASSGGWLVRILRLPGLVVILAVVFAALGLAALAGYNLRLLPRVLEQRLAQHRGEPGTFSGAVGAGMVTAIFVSPCVAAPLAGALLFISTTGDAVSGAQALFALALGMGVLPLACAAGAGSLVPKAGPLTEAVKGLTGLLLLALAVWTVGDLVAGHLRLIAYGSLGLVAALMFAVAAWRGTAPLARGLAWAVAGAFAATGGVYAVGGATGGGNELAPLAHLDKDSQAVDFPTTVTTLASLDETLAVPGQGTLVYYTADWCVTCRELDANTFADRRVATALGKLRRVKVDVTSNSRESKRLLALNGLFGPPALLVNDPDGRLVLKVTGYVGSDSLLAALGRAGMS